MTEEQKRDYKTVRVSYETYKFLMTNTTDLKKSMGLVVAGLIEDNRLYEIRIKHLEALVDGLKEWDGTDEGTEKTEE